LKEVRWLETPRRYGEEERQQRAEAVQTLGRTIELPMERIQGMADLNHWSGWLIDADTYSAYIEPLVGVVTEALAYGLLRLMLAEADPPWPPDLIERMVVAADASQLVQRPDEGKVATEGYTLEVPALSAESWRKANGFGDDDAPSDEELQRRLAYMAGLDQGIAAKVLAALGLIPDVVVAEQAAVAEQVRQQAGPSSGDPAGGNTDTPQGPPPGGAPEGRVAVAAAAGPRRMRLDALSVADRTLSATVQTAVDAAMVRAQEKAGARVRTLAARTAAGRTALAAAGEVRNAGMVAALGPAVVAAVAPDEDLFGGAFDHLEGHWDAWVAAVQAEGVKLADAVGTLTVAQRAEFEEQQADHRHAGWLLLHASLLIAANNLAAGLIDVPDDGEFDDVLAVPPATVREALARAGGATDLERDRSGGISHGHDTPAGLVATGDTVRYAFAAAGVPWVGYEWVYGDASTRARPFEPHRALAGREFETWDDPVLANPGPWPAGDRYQPGDHLWCRCSFVPLAARAEETL
jgi:hypothetical protein